MPASWMTQLVGVVPYKFRINAAVSRISVIKFVVDNTVGTRARYSRVRANSVGGAVAAKAASEAASVERTFSPFGRTHNFQRQLHQISDAFLIGIALVISYQIRRHIHFGNTASALRVQ